MKKVLLAIALLVIGTVIGWFIKATLIDIDRDLTEHYAPHQMRLAEAGIRATLKRQDEAWNRGDIDGFMRDYVKSEDLRFASGGDIARGWQATIDRYKKRYTDKGAMGVLSFTDLEIDVFNGREALVFGRWKLERENDQPNGLFTLHMRKIDGTWVIASDHTSSSQN